MAVAFLRLAVRLQTVSHFVQQFRDYRIAHFMSHALQLFGQLPHAFAGPAQPGLRIAPRDGFDQLLQIRHQCRIFLLGTLASASRTPDAPSRMRG